MAKGEGTQQLTPYHRTNIPSARLLVPARSSAIDNQAAWRSGQAGTTAGHSSKTMPRASLAEELRIFVLGGVIASLDCSKLGSALLSCGCLLRSSSKLNPLIHHFPSQLQLALWVVHMNRGRHDQGRGHPAVWEDLQIGNCSVALAMVVLTPYHRGVGHQMEQGPCVPKLALKPQWPFEQKKGDAASRLRVNSQAPVPLWWLRCACACAGQVSTTPPISFCPLAAPVVWHPSGCLQDTDRCNIQYLGYERLWKAVVQEAAHLLYDAG